MFTNEEDREKDRRLGTPRTLTQAIRNCVLTDKVPKVEDVRAHVRDFMAQKFIVALNRTESDEVRLALQELWNALVGDGK